MTRLVSHSPEDTERIGETLGRLLAPGDVVALSGDLGAGKTCLARGIARGLGVADPVASPTFILVADYPTARGFVLHHADCYRLDSPVVEAEGIGLAELMGGDGVTVVEWAERVASLLPANTVQIAMTAPDDGCRELRFCAHGDRAASLLARLLTLLP